MRSASATASSSWPTAASAASARSPTCAHAPASRLRIWRRSSLHSPEISGRSHAPLRPLLAKEIREVLGGRALWTMLLLMCPLIGYSFFQAVSLYGEASTAGLQSPVLAGSLSPLDGVLVPTLGAFMRSRCCFPLSRFVCSVRKRNQVHCVFWSNCPTVRPP